MRREAARFSSRVLYARFRHTLALQPNGSVACLGLNHRGQAPPDGVDGGRRLRRGRGIRASIR